ncbi:MAG: IS256 family transposase, partial [Planctomycetota bacterium]
AGRVEVALPVSLAEVIEGLSEEVERLTGEAGLLIMKAVMDAEVESLAGPRGRHDPQRRATRWTHQPGYVVLAGKKVNLIKPRVRDLEGHEVDLKSYRRFQSAPRRQRSIYRKLIHGISTRKYERAIEDFTGGYGISKSAVSRELIAATRGSLQALCERQIDELGRLAVLMIDGKEIAGECVVVALGVDSAGKKHIVGLVQGGTENSTVVQHLLDELIERGLDPKQPRLIVLDGSKALRKAVKKTFADRCPVQRCHLHKRRNVQELLPKEYQGSADQRIRTAYAMKDYDQAKAQLEKTVAWLERINPSAAGSLREGPEETLTLHRLGLPDQLRKSLQSTNLIESALSVASGVTERVKRWRGGDMRLRWTAAGLLMAEKRFRRIRGHKLMPQLLAALDRMDKKVAHPFHAA